MARRISMGARREVVWAVAERYAAAGRREKGCILDEQYKCRNQKCIAIEWMCDYVKDCNEGEVKN